MTNQRVSGQSTGVTPRIAAVRAEHRIELREVFDAHASYVWNTLRRLGAPRADLEDLTHDVFVQVQQHLGDYDPSRPMKPWLFGFAFRILSQHRRHANRHPETACAVIEAVDPGAPADEQIADEQRRQLVIAALDGIEPERRPVFILYEIDGVSVGDIARTLNIPVNTAYSRLRIARQEFKTAVVRLRRGER